MTRARFAPRAGRNSRSPTRRAWISSSPSATTYASSPRGPWPRNALLTHWGVADPALKGDDAQKRAAFMEAYRRLGARLTAFVNLPFESLDRAALKSRLADIATMEGATELAVTSAA